MSETPGDAAVATDPATPAAAGKQSRYSSLKNCKVIDDGGGEDWSISQCPGLGGYSLMLNYGDAREDLELRKGGRKVAELNLWIASGGGFNSLGDTVEWRGTGAGEGFVPAALIVRNHVVRDTDHPEHDTALLVVFDLSQACIVAQIDPGANQNQSAREIADGPNRPCLSKGAKP